YTTLFRSDADVPVAVDAVEQLLAGAGEAVHHGGADAALEVLHDRDEVGMGVALVQEQGLAHAVNGKVRGDLQLALEGLALRRPWRDVAQGDKTGLAPMHGYRQP